MSPRLRTLLLGIWMTVLFWPFATHGGYARAGWLALSPAFLSAIDAGLPPGWRWRRISAGLGLWAGEWLLQGAGIPGTLGWLSAWPADRLASRALLLAGEGTAWLLVRRTVSGGQAALVMAVGALALVANAPRWGAEATLAVFGFLAMGLWLLAAFRRQALGLPSVGAPYLLGFAASLLPLVAAGVAAPPAWLNPVRWLALPPRPESNGPLSGFSAPIRPVGGSITPNHTPVLLIRSPAPYYWRAAVYTRFTGTVWSNPGHTAGYQVAADDTGLPLFPLPFESSVISRTITVRVQDLTPFPLHTIFYAGVPESVVPFSRAPVSYSPGSQHFRVSGESGYRLSTIVPQFNRFVLAQAPYRRAPAALSPDLEIPPNLSPRVRQLARQVTRGTATPWTAVEALRTYLVTHYRYALNVPPARDNIVNTFLFGDRQGYCDQFSTAFIMMARSLGIPARWVVGYGPGVYNPRLHGYIVRADDAHSWADVYIAPFGWVPVDPTPGSVLPDAAPRAVPARHLAIHPAVSPLPALGAAAAALIVWRLLSRRPTRRTLVFWLWRFMQSWTRFRLGRRPDVSPRDFAMQWTAATSSDPDVVWRLTHLVEKGLFGPHPLTPQEQWQATLLWGSVWLARHRSSG